MDEFTHYLAVPKGKYSGHLKTISQLLHAYTVPINHPGLETPDPGLQTEQLPRRAFRQPKRLVEPTVRIRNMCGTHQVVFLKIPLCCLQVRHVYQHQFTPVFLNLGLALRQVLQGLPTEGTTEVAKKNKQDRLLVAKLSNTLSPERTHLL